MIADEMTVEHFANRLLEYLKSDPHLRISPEYFDTPTAARYLGFSAEQLKKWRRGGGPQYIKLARHVRYKRSDLDHWMVSQRVPQSIARGER